MEESEHFVISNLKLSFTLPGAYIAFSGSFCGITFIIKEYFATFSQETFYS